MSEYDDNIASFEIILQRSSRKNTLKLYNNCDFLNVVNCAPRDVLKQVSSQLKAIQQADSFICKSDCRIRGMKQSSFLNVNSLPIYKEVQKQTTKFDTQYVSDTQLVQLVDNIDENAINTEMVQDFHTTFENVNCDEENKNERDVKCLKESSSQINVIEDEKNYIFNSSLNSREVLLHSSIHSEFMGNQKPTAHCSNIQEQSIINSTYRTSDRKGKHVCGDPYMNTNIVKDDAIQLEASENSSKQIAFVSSNIKSNKYNEGFKCKYGTTSDVNSRKEVAENFESSNLAVEDMMPPSLILNIKKAEKDNKSKEDNQNCCFDNSNNDNVLKEKNFRTDAIESVIVSGKKILNRDKENLSVTKHLFTEDFDVCDYEYNIGTRSCSIFMETPIPEKSEEDNITIEPNKTLHHDVNMDIEFDNKFDNIEAQQCTLSPPEIERNMQYVLHYAEKGIKVEVQHKTAGELSLACDEDNLESNKFSKAKSIEEDDLQINKNSESDEVFKIIKEENYKSDSKIVKDLCLPINEQSSSVCLSSLPEVDFDTDMKNDPINYCTGNNNYDTGASIFDGVKAFEEENRPISPILDVNVTNQKSKTPSPLIFDLEHFEKFESIAYTLISSVKDVKEAKKLLDTQNLNNELHVYENQLECKEEETNYILDNKSISKISKEFIRESKNDIDDIKAEDLSFKRNTNNNKEDLIKLNEKITIGTSETNLNLGSVNNDSKDLTHIDDEILFSSDEESVYIEKEYKELPPTCVLDTSCHNNTSYDLSKAMYEEFHSASKKTKHVCTDSYCKSSLWNEIDKPTVDLVNLVDTGFENNASKIRLASQKEINQKAINKNTMKDDCVPNIPKDSNISVANTANAETSFINTKLLSIDCELNLEDNIKYKNNTKIPTRIRDKRPFEGFMTANNKKIKLPDAGIARSKQIFVDIDIDEDLKLGEDESLNYLKEHSNFQNNIKPHNIKSRGQWVNSKVDSNDDVTNTEIIVSMNDKNKVINPGTTNRESLTQLNMNDEMLIREFEDIEMSLEETNTSTKNNIDEMSNNSKNPTDNKHTPIDALRETEGLLNDLDITSIVDNNSKNSKIVIKNNFKSNANSDYINGLEYRDLNVNDRENLLQENNNLNRNVNIAKRDQFKGFKTASDKPILISEKALINTKKIFSDIENDNFVDGNISKPTSGDDKVLYTTKVNLGNNGFKTASNKHIHISDESLHKRKNIFNDIEITEINDNSERIKHMQVTSLNNVINVHKDRAENTSNKPKIHNKEKIKNIFKDIDFQGYMNLDQNNKILKYKGIQANNIAATKNVLLTPHDEENQNKHCEAIEVKSPILKCSTPNTKLFKLSDDSFKRIKTTTNKSDGIIEKNYNVGFETANNKPIDCSTEYLKNTKNMFEDRFDSPHNIQKKNEPYITNTEVKSPILKCFQTANNRPVRGSKEALIRTSNIFKDINISKPCEDIDKKFDEFPRFVGFQTANNKSIKISKQALQKTKDISKDIDSVKNDLNDSSDPNITLKTVQTFGGFQTASKNPVKVSKEAIKNTKDSFKDILLTPGKKEYQNSPEKEIINKSPIFKGFQTANKKHVSISKEALKRTKDLVKDISEISINTIESDGNKNIPKCKGFQTANKKPVKISSQALLKTKNVFKYININEEFPAQCFQTELKNKLQGFQTASIKKVGTSMQALEKCKNIFDDIDLSTNLCENYLQYTKGDVIITSNKNIEDNIIDEKVKYFKEMKADYCNNSNNNKYCDNKERLNNKENNNKYNLKGNESSLDSKNVANQINVHEALNTQLLNNFEETLYSEDFHKTPLKDRPISPILSCPRAKKRKFEVPYKANINKNIFQLASNFVVEKNTYNFDVNYKKDKKYCLKDLISFETDFALDKNADQISHLEDIDLKTFVFKNDRNDLNDKFMSVAELKSIFEGSVGKKLIPDNWFENHLRMIIWKLLDYENNLPNCMKNVCRVRNVLEQLKYRYDIELYNAKRSALRRILERDDIPSKFMILKVVGIYVDGAATTSAVNPKSNIELLLSDGWYTLKTIIDKMLATLVCSKKITIGTKLATSGAELLNCDQGISPWEDTSSVRLKIHGNSTRRAPWHARLGYNNAAILSTLGAVKMDGGKVSNLRLFMTRVYPALYVEKLDDGNTVTRSERIEHLYQTKYENERAVTMEKLYEEVEKEMSDTESQDSEDMGASKRRCLDTGSQIAKKMRKCQDPAEFRSYLTSTQMKLLEDHTNKRREKLLEDMRKRVRDKMEAKGLCINRNVIQLLKIRVIGLEKNGDVTKGVLSIWKPNDAILDLIKEGAWIDVSNVVPTALRQLEIHISAGRQAFFKKHIPKSDIDRSFLDIYKRQGLRISELVKQPSNQYNEIDTVGVVIDIDPKSTDFDANKHNLQNVYLVDEYKSVASITFWGGLKKFGYENIFEIGQVVCCINLRKRIGNSRMSVPGFRVTEFSYFTKTPKYEDLRSISDDLCKNMARVDFKKFRAECLLLKNNLIKRSYVKFNYCGGINTAKSSSIIKKDDLNLSGLDFESTFKQSERQDISPKLLQRKREINEKIAKLKKYGEPPPLNPIYVINKSKNASNNFKSPLITKDDNAVKSTSSNNNDRETDKSSKGEFLKVENRRLNFSKNETYVNEVIDPFAEDFDGSPPLSLN